MVPARKYRAPSVYCVLRGRVSRPRREEGGIWGCWAGLPPSENSRLPWAVVSSSDWPRPAAHTATPPPADAKLGAAEHSPSVVASLRAANILCLFCSTQRKQQCRAGVLALRWWRAAGWRSKIPRTSCCATTQKSGYGDQSPISPLSNFSGEGLTRVAFEHL